MDVYTFHEKMMMMMEKKPNWFLTHLRRLNNSCETGLKLISFSYFCAYSEKYNQRQICLLTRVRIFFCAYLKMMHVIFCKQVEKVITLIKIPSKSFKRYMLNLQTFLMKFNYFEVLIMDQLGLIRFFDLLRQIISENLANPKWNFCSLSRQIFSTQFLLIPHILTSQIFNKFPLIIKYFSNS